MSSPFIDIVAHEKKTAIEKQKKFADEVKKLVCPKCGSRATEVGMMHINEHAVLDQSLVGDYCYNCFSVFIASNVSKFVKEESHAQVPNLSQGGISAVDVVGTDSGSTV